MRSWGGAVGSSRAVATLAGGFRTHTRQPRGPDAARGHPHDPLRARLTWSPCPIAIQRIEEDWTAWTYSTVSVLDPKSFPWTYGATEQCYVTSGSATVTPDGGGEPIVLEAGVMATFPAGMSCTWEVPDRITKRFIFPEDS